MDTVEMAPGLHFRWQIFPFLLLFGSALTRFCFSNAKSPGPEDSGLLLLTIRWWWFFFAGPGSRCTSAGFTFVLAFLWFGTFLLDFLCV